MVRNFRYLVSLWRKGGSPVADCCVVNGLQDDAERGIRRSKFCLTGAEVRKIFEPVIHEVIKLIEGQIETTKSKVKAILLVGGFGQSAYLRERIKEIVWRRNIEVMQSPGGYVFTNALVYE